MNRAVALAIALFFGFLLFLRVEDRSPDRYVILDLADHPPGTATPYVPRRAHFPAFYLVHSPEGEVYAIVRLAPRSKCLVVWDDAEAAFVDPCDGARYGWDGTPLQHDGPSLQRLALERSEIGRVLVDLGKRLPGPTV